MSSKFCFGVFSVFAENSVNCSACECKNDCMLEAYCKLNTLAGVEKVKTLLKKHQQAMKRAGLIVVKDHDVVDIKPAVEQKEPDVLSRMLEQLASDGICSEGYIAEDLSNAPEYFKVICDHIRINGKVTQKEIVTNLGLSIPNDKINTVRSSALGLQILVKNKIVEAKGNTVKWIGSKK